MTKINLIASDQLLSLSTNPILASGDRKTDTLHIDFSEEWAGLTLSAVFFTDKDATVYEVLLDGDCNCTIPHEALDKDCILFIGARGVNANTAKVKTSTLIKYKIKKGAPSGTASTVAPTPDVYQQILANQEALKAETEAELEEIRELVENIETGGGSGGGGGDLSRADVVDNLLSTATDLPLSANQGRVLAEKMSVCEKITVTSAYVDLFVYKVGNIAYIGRYTKFKTSISAGTEVLLGTLPEGFRPPFIFMHSIFVTKGATFAGDARIWIETDGKVYMRPHFDVDTSTDFTWGFNYIVGTSNA